MSVDVWVYFVFRVGVIEGVNSFSEIVIIFVFVIVSKVEDLLKV